MNPSSLSAVAGASLPWQAFLVPSVPNFARKELGDSYFAFRELVGPMSLRHRVMASGAISSMPTAKSEDIN